jgi:hypothetical protein
MANDIQRTLGDGRAPVVHVCEGDALLVAQGTGDDLALGRDHDGIAGIEPLDVEILLVDAADLRHERAITPQPRGQACGLPLHQIVTDRYGRLCRCLDYVELPERQFGETRVYGLCGQLRGF